MARIIDIPFRRPGIAGIVAISLAFLDCRAMAGGMRALLVGGGPDKENNTAQIEEHLHFVASLVPASPGRIILFADGKAASRNLSYTDSTHLTNGQRALDILLPNDGLGPKMLTRTADLGVAVYGPSKLAAIDRAFARLASEDGKSPVLVYFAGHGSQSENKDKTSVYNLWGSENLDPATLLREIDTLPARVPVTLVMAQCFSGGFGNILFQKANPSQPINDRLIIGFFAAESDREAAGCGTETNSPLYQDFSSYFFGALSGKDRLGHEISGADYDGDGKVSCYEAYCYALIHDESIDTPIDTSLVFLRRSVDLPDDAIFQTPWQSVIKTASPAQRAVLDALSARLSLDGEQRLLAAYDRLMFSDPMAQPARMREYRDAQDHLNTLRMDSLHSLFAKWPALRWRDSRDYSKATRGAADDLQKDTARCQEIIQTGESFGRADAAIDEEEALLVRFTDLCEAIVRAQHLREHADTGTKARFEQLWQAEQQPLDLSRQQ